MEENKFNFSEEEKQVDKEKVVEEKKEAVKKDAKGLFESISTFLSELLDFRDDTDRDATITAIKADISFKGATAWILICSIMVASVGLNADSTAVVIGAMLISPLMGPILGIGMALAINDIDTLKKSLINLVTMILLSLLTAFLFFRIFPTAEIITSELAGRTKPDIRDVLIAFFGGLALIIARTKKGTIASVIFGVAIATALMPPLCTAGYGLANWVRGIEGGFDNFLGALNLFTINTIFIALATFIVLKVLRFPMLKYANSKKRKRIAQLASLVAIMVMIYPIISFVSFIGETRFESQVNKFEKEVKEIRELQVLNFEPNYEGKLLEISFFNEVPESTRGLLLNRLRDESTYPDLKNVELRIKGSDTKSYELISNAYQDTREELRESKNIISGLQKQIENLESEISSLNQQIESKSSDNSVGFSTLSKDAKIKFSDLEYFGYSKMLVSKDFVSVDTINVASANWKPSLSDSIVKIKDEELLSWLKQQLKVDEVVLKRN